MTRTKSYPVYMRSSVTPQFLAKNPIYKNIFKRCPNCNNFSLKPIRLDRIVDITQIANTQERKCSLCGYTHIKDLVVSTTMDSFSGVSKSNMVIKEGRILEDDTKK